MKIAVIGTVGVPGRYGGFETLAEQLVLFHGTSEESSKLTVWCSSIGKHHRPVKFEGADLRYIGLRANGIQSVLYDALSLLAAVRSRHDRILLLGVSGALMLPLIRLISRARIICNVDGIEWKRRKWNWAARAFLRASEKVAVTFSHHIIADNQAIADYIFSSYSKKCHVIAYGGDHALNVQPLNLLPEGLPEQYSLSLCRIEPENNVEMILKAFADLGSELVFVGNWNYSEYGQDLKRRFSRFCNLHLVDAVFDPGILYAIRSHATLYVHGHSAGGTNPSLVEMMHFGIPVLAYDCIFNRYTTEFCARYFGNASDIAREVRQITADIAAESGAAMLEIANRCYTWDIIGNSYFSLLEHTSD